MGIWDHGEVNDTWNGVRTYRWQSGGGEAVEDGSREENATKNRKNGKIVNKRAEHRIFQAEAVVRGRKEKFSTRALGQNLAWGYR